jgi:hypothetical protein
VLFLKSLAAWFVILCLAVANGALREAVLIPVLGKQVGLVSSGVLLTAFVALVAYLFVRSVRGMGLSNAVRTGILWACLTVLFEFGFGRWVQHKSWAELLDAYTFKEGNIWPLVLLVVLLAPAALAMAVSRGEHASRDA